MAVRTSTGYEALIMGPNAFDTIFHNGCIEIRSGPQPVSADAAATGTLLARVTANGGAWTQGNAANGLRFARDGRFAMKLATQRWVIKGIASGVAGWFRLRRNGIDAGGESLILPRIDGAIALPDSPGEAQLFIPTLAMTPSTTIELPSWWFAKPE